MFVVQKPIHVFHFEKQVQSDTKYEIIVAYNLYSRNSHKQKYRTNEYCLNLYVETYMRTSNVVKLGTEKMIFSVNCAGNVEGLQKSDFIFQIEAAKYKKDL